jgi:phosphatidylglycerol---prolipoprotein diacylglyceryl transferase
MSFRSQSASVAERLQGVFGLKENRPRARTVSKIVCSTHVGCTQYRYSLSDMSLSALCYGLGYLTGLGAFAWMAHRRGFRSESIWLVMQAGLIGGLLGANLAQWALGGAPGKTVLGGIAGGWLAVAAAKRYAGVRRPTGDLFAVALCAGEAVGRFGCFFGGCCHGKASQVPWAVWQHEALRHPAQLYLSAVCLLILVALFRMERWRPVENLLFYSQGALYCSGRFVVEFFRESTAHGGLTTAQWACAAGTFFFVSRLFVLVSNPAAVAPPVIGRVLEELP